MKKIHEYERIVLKRDLLEHSLCAGDIGTVVLVHRNGEGFEVEFMTLDGETIAVTTLMATDVRPIAKKEMAHARSLESIS
jgi:hypothetical protein